MDGARKVKQNKENFARGLVTENMEEHDTAISMNIKVRTTSSSGKVIKIKTDLSSLVPYIELCAVMLFPGPALQQLSFYREREREKAERCGVRTKLSAATNSVTAHSARGSQVWIKYRDESLVSRV